MKLHNRWFLLFGILITFSISTLSLINTIFNRNLLTNMAVKGHKNFSKFISRSMAEYIHNSNLAGLQLVLLSELGKNYEIVYFYFFNKDKLLLFDINNIYDPVETSFILKNGQRRGKLIEKGVLNIPGVFAKKVPFTIEEKIIFEKIKRGNIVVGNNGDGVFEINQDVYYKEIFLGRFTLGLSMSELNQSIEKLTNVIIIIGVVLYIFSLIIVYFYGRRLTDPIMKLSKELGKMEFTFKSTSLINSLEKIRPENIKTPTWETKNLKQAFVELKSRLVLGLKQIEDLQHLKEERQRLDIFVKTAQMLAHDVRRPFSQLEMLLKNLDVIQKNPQRIEDAKLEIGNAKSLVDDIVLDIVEFNKSKPLELQYQFVSENIQKELKRQLLNYSGFSLEIEVSNVENYEILIHEAQFKRVIQNIVGNAIEAMYMMGNNEHGKMKIELHDQGNGNVELSFINNGPLIPEENIPHLFDIFFSKGKKFGTGIGLSSVAQILKRHHGSVRVENIYSEKEGIEKGVKFTLRLKGRFQQKGEKISQDLEKINEIDTDVKKGEILVVENDDFYAHLLISLLESLKLKVLWVKTIEKAKEAISKKRFELAIVDFKLDNEESGLEIIEFIKSEGFHTKFYIHSNTDLENSIPQKWEKSFIPKPMTYSKLKEILGPYEIEENIFIVDDSEIGLLYVENLIKEYCLNNPLRNFKTYSFTDKNIELIFDHDCDPFLAILDYKIGHINGLDLFLKFKKVFPQCTVFLLTNDNSEELKEKAMALGIEDVFSAPLDDKSLRKIFLKKSMD